MKKMLLLVPFFILGVACNTEAEESPIVTFELNGQSVTLRKDVADGLIAADAAMKKAAAESVQVTSSMRSNHEQAEAFDSSIRNVDEQRTRPDPRQ